MCGRSRLREIARSLRELHRKVDRMSENQDRIDALVQRLSVTTDGIRQDVADLKAAAQAGEPLDFTALEDKVSALEGLDAENPAPAEPTE